MNQCTLIIEKEPHLLYHSYLLDFLFNKRHFPLERHDSPDSDLDLPRNKNGSSQTRRKKVSRNDSTDSDIDVPRPRRKTGEGQRQKDDSDLDVRRKRHDSNSGEDDKKKKRGKVYLFFTVISLVLFRYSACRQLSNKLF